MVLKLPNVVDDQTLFTPSPSYGQLFKTRGGRYIPSDDNDTSTPTAELLVAADGSGDYTTIAAALTALGSNPGVIRIKAGTYNISSSINTTAGGQIFIGSGWDTVIDTTTNNIRAFVLDQSKCKVENVKIVGTRTVGSLNDGILISSDDCVVRNVRIDETGEHGIYVSSANRTLIESCYIFDCADDSIFISGSPKTIVTNCHILNSDKVGVKMTGAATYSIITNNIIADHSDDGIYMDDQDDCIIEGNILEGNGSAATEDGIHVYDCEDCIFIGNRVRGSAGYGLSLDAAATVADRACIVGNILTNNTTGALDDNGTNTTTAGNITA